jgi:hypothetical protein
MKFIHSIWFTILLVILISGCNSVQIKGQILGDPNQIAIIKVPKGGNVAGIVVPKDGIYLSEEALVRTIESILQDGFKMGYEAKQYENKLKQI